MKVERAHETDLQALVALNNRFAPEGLTLTRSEDFAYAHLADYRVIRDADGGTWVTGFMIAGIVSGNFILETLFVIPGVGTYAVQGLATADYPVIQGVALVVAISVVTVNLGVDIAYAWLDPRVVYA